MNKNKMKRELFDANKIPIEGSLGVLALGDVGFTAWREIKKASNRNDIHEEE
ncbi:MAG: hypothetical protein R3359_01380 [Marinirhabdus sp.]|nr:hypothetical protein [Marinirhabdus sp.]